MLSLKPSGNVKVLPCSSAASDTIFCMDHSLAQYQNVKRAKSTVIYSQLLRYKRVMHIQYGVQQVIEWR